MVAARRQLPGLWCQDVRHSGKWEIGRTGVFCDLVVEVLKESFQKWVFFGEITSVTHFFSAIYRGSNSHGLPKKPDIFRGFDGLLYLPGF